MSESPHCVMYKGDEALYREYLSFSWQYHQIPMTKADEWIAKKKILFNEIKNSGIEEPVRVFQDRQGRYYYMDGNHRLSAAIALGHKTVPCRVLSFREYLSEFCKTNTKYGTGTLEGKPYQTFYDTKGCAVFEGRRSDILKRHALITKHVDFRGKTVLDLGGNYGNASNLALGSGASQVHVVDYDKHVIGAAVTLGVLVEASGANYYVHNLQNYLTAAPECDVGFCFSITAHVKQLENLCRTIRDKVKSVLVYETHEGHSMEPEIKALFSRVEKIGALGSRQLYVCHK